MRRGSHFAVCAGWVGVAVAVATCCQHASAQEAGPPHQTGASAALLESVLSWLERARREYQDTVIHGLSVPTGKGTLAKRERPNEAKSALDSVDAVPTRPLAGASAVQEEIDARTRGQIESLARESERPAEMPAPVVASSPPASSHPESRPQQPVIGEPVAPRDARPSAVADHEPKSPVRWNRLQPSAARGDGGKKYRVSVRSAQASETMTVAAPRKAAIKVAGDKLAEAATAAGARTLTRRGDHVASLAIVPPGRLKQSCRRAGKQVDPPAIYTVKRGDNLWTISRRHYDLGRRYTKIVRANEAKIAAPNRIFPCQKLYLPG